MQTVQTEHRRGQNNKLDLNYRYVDLSIKSESDLLFIASLKRPLDTVNPAGPSRKLISVSSLFTYDAILSLNDR